MEGRWEKRKRDKLGDLFEVRTSSRDLVNDIFNRDNTILTKSAFDNFIRAKGNPLLVDLSITSLVDQFSNSLQVGLSVGDVRFDSEEHFRSSFGDFDEDSVVDLEETEELQDFAGLGGNVVDTESQKDDILVS